MNISETPASVRLVEGMQAYYKDWYKIGGGLANKNLLCYGDFPAYANDMSEKSLVYAERRRYRRQVRPDSSG